MRRLTLRSAALGGAGLVCAALAGAQPAGEPVLEEVVVTGSYIRRPSQFDTPAPLTMVRREDLEALGVGEVGEVVEDLTINTGSQNNPDAFTQNFSTGTTNVNLRGMGVGSTLVLVNGRRQTQSAVATDRGENFVDTSSLPPMIAFDRVEILKDGATSLYGSEAVAGVVNFITRESFDGLDLELELRTVDDHPQDDTRLSVLWGRDGERTDLLVAGSMLERSPLTTNDRRLSSTSDDLSQAGNPGSFLIPSVPGNPAYRPVWTSAFDTNGNGIADAVEPQLGLPSVPGAQLPVFADPDCAAIAAQDPKVVPAFQAEVPSPIGTIPIGLCQFDFGDFYSLVPEEERLTGFVQVDHVLSDSTAAQLELHVADNEASRNNSPSFPFAAFPTVPATHPDNPYGTDVRFIGRVRGAGGTVSPSTHESETWRLAGDLIHDANDTWRVELGFSLSENEFRVGAEDVLVDRFDMAIQGFGGPGCLVLFDEPPGPDCAYFNPFGTALTGTGTVNSDALFDWLVGRFSYDASSELATLDGVVTGEIGSVAGGPVAIAAGAQLRRDEIAYDYDANANAGNFLFFAANPDFSGDRDISAVFVELGLPLAERFEMQLAARHEDYGDGLDSTDPKLSFLWRPTDTVSLRASFGTSFRAPSLFQAFGTQTTLSELIDPSVGIPQFFPVRTQPNPSGARLEPEQADVANLGLTWSVTERLELGLDYWAFDYDDVIIQQSPQAILNAAAGGDTQAASQVVRDPQSGLLLRVDSFYANASTLETDGVDFSIEYDFATTGADAFTIGAEATLMGSYDIDDPQTGLIDGLGRRNFANFATSTPELRRAFRLAARGSQPEPVLALRRRLRRRRGRARPGSGGIRADREPHDAGRALQLPAARRARPRAELRRDEPARRGPAPRRDERRLRLEGARSARPRAVRAGELPVLRARANSASRRRTAPTDRR